MKKRKKRAFTLLEIIIVISLITLITGAIGYKMKGALDRGRAFRTEQAIEQLHDFLLMCVEDGKEATSLANRGTLLTNLQNYDIAKNPEALLKDGWGVDLKVEYLVSLHDFRITSAKLESYKAKIEGRIISPQPTTAPTTP